MTTNYCPSPFHLELSNNNGDHQIIFDLNVQPSSSSSSSSSTTSLTYPTAQEQGAIYRNESHHDHQQADHDQGNKLLLGSRVGSSSCDHERENCFKFSICRKKKQDHDQKQFIPSSSNPNDDDNISIRVCSDCNTTKTPLWRSGPRGPKSLCNACGIRQRKARRAAALAANGGTVTEVSKLSSAKTKKVIKVQQKEKKKLSRNNNNNNIDGVLLPLKKRCKLITNDHQSNSNHNNKKTLCFEDLSMMILNKNSAYNQRIFPQDEREAAILLMALSYGLVSG